MRQVLVGDWAGEPIPEVQVRRRLPPPRGPLLFEGVGLLKGVLARDQAGETKVLQHVSGAGPAAKVGTWYLAVFCVRGGSLA